MINIYKLK